MGVWYVRFTHPETRDFREVYAEVPDDHDEPRAEAIRLARRQNERITADLRQRDPPIDSPLYLIDGASVQLVGRAPVVDLGRDRQQRWWNRLNPFI